MKLWGASRGWVAAGLMGLLPLAACAPSPVTVVAEQPTHPQARIVPPAPVVAVPSEQSKELAIYYRHLQQGLLTQGLLRGDGGGPDTPFTDTMLARNFKHIALFHEYASDGGILRPQATESQLQRWEQPIRMSVEFGDTVPLAQRDKDKASVSTFAARLSHLSGVPITLTEQDPNYHVLFLNEDDRLGYERQLRTLIPKIETSTVRNFMNMPRDQLCFVITSAQDGDAKITKAVVLIRGEHPDLLRTLCIHEELAQGMGLPNDSPQARPSIFNDDNEFALLTGHDEMLIKMLYDPRLQTGIAPAQAEPIVRVIAREIMGNGSS